MLNQSQDNVVDEKETKIVETAEDHHHVEHNDQVDPEVLIIKEILLDDGELPLLLSESCCIYRVPCAIRRINEEAYTPKVVSVGLLHCRNSRLHNMKSYKMLLFKKFLDRSNTRLEDLINYVKSVEPEVRACYSENIALYRGRIDLVKLILVDASFIIELFLKNHENELFEANAIMSIPSVMTNIWNDLLCLENQLPFFVLQELFDLAFPDLICKDKNLPSLLELTFEFFRGYNMQNIKPNPHIRIKHFTDLLRIFYLPTDYEVKRSRLEFKQSGNNVLSHSASELHEKGVKLKASQRQCLLELKFSSGRDLEIPQIPVNRRTETLFRNMIAFEQCHYPFESYITDYALLMDCLINTRKDVDVLVHQNIIINMLGDSYDVVKIFNGLCKDISYLEFNSNYLEICTGLNKFYKNRWNNWKATLRNEYCSTPWKVAASTAAVVLLVLTIIQTICSVIK